VSLISSKTYLLSDEVSTIYVASTFYTLWMSKEVQRLCCLFVGSITRLMRIVHISMNK